MAASAASRLGLVDRFRPPGGRVPASPRPVLFNREGRVGRRTPEGVPMRASGLSVVAAVVLASVGGRACAQPAPGVGAPPRPVVSPYLNLARRDVNPAVNYYGIVRPQLATSA